MTTNYLNSFLPPFLRRGELADLPPSRGHWFMDSGMDVDVDVSSIDTKRAEFYSIWLSFTYGLDSDPI